MMGGVKVEGIMETLPQRYQDVCERITKAALACGRDPASVLLLAVSKTFGPEAVRSVAACGQRDFGENYIQEGVDKIRLLRAEPATAHLVWHCIGPIQSNKTRPVAEHFDWVHSIDRLKIAQRLNEQRPPDLPPLQVCLQVNVDGGPTKSGVAPEQVLALAQDVCSLPRLQLRGLMTIPDPSPDPQAQLAVHRRTHALWLTLKDQLPQARWDTLSMGMTADLEAAVQAGSTLLRIGTAIFGRR
jgi:pyridoxal phosphate enzyme (YggS family)